MNAQFIIQQGTIGASRPEGKLPGVPLLTLVVPNNPHSQTNLTKFQLIHYLTKENIFIHPKSLSNHPTLILIDSLEDSYFKKVFNMNSILL